MKRMLLCVGAMLLAVSVAWEACGQCVDGSCRVYNGWRPAPRVDVKVKVKQRPTPAWRYVRPVGHRAAVVRVYCQDSSRMQSIGSGVLVRWGKRIMVLTARHVVKDAKRVVVETFRKKTYRAKVIKVDAAWDCAVLELSDTPEGIEPAEIELGPAAMFKDGDRLESCGYGPDGKLACNTGLFQGYRRSTADLNGPDDWMVVSGHARGGDSGGPVFNARGRVVGVIWGYDGQTVVSVQAGRIHQLLDEAVAAYQQQALPILQRNPTPPKPAYIPQPPLVAVPPADTADEVAQREGKKPLLPWRGESEARDRQFENRLNGLLTAQEQERQARITAQGGGTSVDVQVGPKQEKEAKPETEPTPLGVALCLAGAVLVGFVVFYSIQKN